MEHLPVVQFEGDRTGHTEGRHSQSSAFRKTKDYTSALGGANGNTTFAL